MDTFIKQNKRKADTDNYISTIKEDAKLHLTEENVRIIKRDTEIISDFLSFLDECDSDDEVFSTLFKGEADVSASVKIGEQHENSPGEEIHQTVRLENDQAPVVLGMTADPDRTRMNEDNDDVSSITKFLERPQLIGQFTWSRTQFDNASNFVDLRPWSLYLNTAVVTDKVNNFKLFRARGLRLTFLINGSPFHYGRLFAGVVPGNFLPLPFGGMDNPNNGTVSPDNMGTVLNGTTLPLRTHYSQWPGVMIDPSTNVTQQIEVPFVWPQNYLSLLSTGDDAFVTRLVIWTLNELRHANDSDDPVTLSVLASIIDPVLSMPTITDAFTGEAFHGEAGKAGTTSKASTKPKTRKSKKAAAAAPSTSKGGGDEYGKGVVSEPASALANFCGTLEKVPVLGTYATATKIALQGVSRIASLFGYSRPCMVDDPNYFCALPSSSLAVTSGGDCSMKLTLDPKQELTIDPTTVGLQSIDEMSLAHLVKRESLIVQLQWQLASAASSALAHIAVGPWNCPVNNTLGIFWHTALSWATSPFIYWRGSLKYRFQIVASQNHRGRLAIVYNTRANGTSTATLPNMAATHQIIMDLAECRDMTVVVRHGHQNAWLPLHPPTGTWVTATASTNFADAIKMASNGVLSIYVLNELGAPISTSAADVTINIFISAGDDFMVANPGQDLARMTPFASVVHDQYAGEANLEAFHGEASMADYTATNEDMPVGTECVVLNGSEDDTPDVDDVNLVFFGEQVVSIRALLKRPCFYMAWYTFANAPATQPFFRWTHGHMPQSAGLVSSTGNFDLNQGGSVNFVFTTLLDWYKHGYMLYRGAIRYKFLPTSSFSATNNNMMRVHRDPAPHSNATRYLREENVSVLGAAATATEDQRNVAYLAYAKKTTNAGAAIVGLQVKSALEFEHPFMSPMRFHWMKRGQVDTTDSDNPDSVYDYEAHALVRDAHSVITTYAPGQANAPGNLVEVWVSAGEDFSLHYFAGAPVMGFEPIPE